MSLSLSAQIEGILFYQGESMSRQQLCSMLQIQHKVLNNALEELSLSLEHRGICLIATEHEVVLKTHPFMAETIEQLRKEELSKELTKPALESLAIILYMKGATKNDIDYIRGVNSQSILRSLVTRGLVDRMPNKEDARKPRYVPSVELLAFLGIQKPEMIEGFEQSYTTLMQLLQGSDQVLPIAEE
jgi:segregation and condensation protein B